MSDREFDLIASRALGLSERHPERADDLAPLGVREALREAARERTWARVKRAIGPAWLPTFAEIAFAAALAACALGIAFQSTKPSLPPTEPLGTQAVAFPRPPTETAYEGISRLAGG